jgi:hypothetical protein
MLDGDRDRVRATVPARPWTWQECFALPIETRVQRRRTAYHARFLKRPHPVKRLRQRELALKPNNLPFDPIANKSTPRSGPTAQVGSEGSVGIDIGP